MNNNSWHHISHDFVVSLDNTARDLRNLADELARPFGLSNSRWLVLYILEEHGSALSQKDLAAEIGIEGPTMVRILDGMERDGWVRRRVSDKDRRVKLIDVEEKTWGVMRELSEKLDAAKEVMLKGISNEEMIEGTELLERIRQQILQLSGRKTSHNPCPKSK
ncbi:MarR family winged helix-turn-helix transcriptional regulator [Desulfovibrio ferrophilus]|uniref:Transcriptional regulator, MarR family n=1 Tax=Desulfovibrio ferrophilus TaxID=241368 RepID=A0A2Z6AYE8_9BACT|nr:MarR family transcriptional regulator [Desulfovibrio ferrophilus]BBD08284.1 transcriptional regulator, MarR family [Desulfovibrio ferrophilus]